MKTGIFTIFALLIIFSACSKVGQKQDTYYIEGYLTGFFEGKSVLYRLADGELVPEDSVYVKKSRFKFKTHKVAHPQMMFLVVGDREAMIELFVENTRMRLNANLNNPDETELSGSESHKAFSLFSENNSVYENRIHSIELQLQQAVNSSDSVLINQLNTEKEKLLSEQKDFIFNYIKSHPDSYVAAYLSVYALGDELPSKKLRELSDDFTDEIKASFYWSELQTKIKRQEQLEVGKQAPDFTLNTIDMQPESLVSHQGRKVLLYFWASWCGPCRADNPALHEIEKKYPDLDIVGISLDTHISGWENVIKADSINWTQLSDLKGHRAGAAKLYNVKEIPFYYILDEKGIIKAKNADISIIKKQLAAKKK